MREEESRLHFSLMFPKILFIFLISLSVSYGQKNPEFLSQHQKRWVDSIFANMTLDQKIGQLLMPRGNFSGKPHDIEQLKTWVTIYKIGGVVFFAGNPTVQVDITNQLQAISDIPLWIGQDFEWGTAMRLDSTVQFPYALTLGAYQGDLSLLEEMGQEIGQHCNRLGVHINYAPVVDINSNPLNPVINFRSFGENRENVTQKALAVWKGMNSKHIICTAKHFPGHGDTQTDSHADLPVVTANKEALLKADLGPFSDLIKAGIPGIMSAHIQVPSLDDTPHMPATLSRKIIHDLLRKELGFEGLVFTDAMDMQGVLKNHEQGEAIILALIAGNDIIETFLDVPLAVESVKTALLNGRLTYEWLDYKVKKILKAKSWVGLDHYVPVNRENLVQDLNSYQSEFINEKLSASAITLIKNEGDILPLPDEAQKIVLLSLNNDSELPLADMIRNYTKIKQINIKSESIKGLNLDSLTRLLEDAEIIITAAFFSSMRPAKNYGLSNEFIKILESIGSHKKSVLLWMGNPYGLEKVNLSDYQAVLCGYQDSKYTQRAIAQKLWGAGHCQGVLPVTLKNLSFHNPARIIEKPKLIYGSGNLTIDKMVRLHKSVDSMMTLGLNEHVFPGAALQVIYRDKVILQKSFGSPTYSPSPLHAALIQNNSDNVMDQSTSGSLSKKIENYENGQKVNIHDIYDLASLTKILGSAFAFMRWVDEGKISPDDSISSFFPEWKSFPVGSLTFRDCMTHRSGLPAWIPFWRTSIDSVKTLQMALKQDIKLDSLCVLEVKKPFFLWRWLGKKPVTKVSIEKTIKINNKTLWNTIFNTKELYWNSKYYSTVKNTNHSIRIRDSLWLSDDYTNEIYRQIIQAPLGKKGDYLYSDLHFYLYPELCKRLTGSSLETYLDSLYGELNLPSLGYLPLKKFPLTSIIPTEVDSTFRISLIHGNVHDEGAIMMGGVSGHAGLFSDVNDVSKLLYLFLKNGKTENKTWLRESTIKEFTDYQFKGENNRRALIFDKKDPSGKAQNAPKLASPSSYGHSGFTGTYAWVDPDYDLVIVFLSNRVHPTRNNGKINQFLFRQNLCDEVYKVILE